VVNAARPEVTWAALSKEEHNYMGTPVSVGDDDFEARVLNSEQPVVVDFWAEWCGPCKLIAPTLEEIAGDMKGKITVAKLNIDDNPHTPAKYGVKGIPTLIVFKGGQVAATKLGTLPKSQLIQWIESVI
jgi:thioredoxin 1